MGAWEHGCTGAWGLGRVGARAHGHAASSMFPCSRAPMHTCSRALLRLSVACAILLAAGVAAAKPTAPILLTARVTESDPATGAARVEVRARSLVPGTTVHVQCDLPKGAVVVPGSGEWATDAQGERVLTMRITLPPDAGRAVIRADLRGEGVRIDRIIGLDLPAARQAGEAAAAPANEATPRIITTGKGEKLRVHKQ